jgi:RNA polymerase sigma-70 factor, ECF subfamily
MVGTMVVRHVLDEHEARLIRHAQASDPDAVAELYRQYAPVIFRYFYARLGERPVAEDLTGAVFVRVLEGLPHYEDRGRPFPAWLFRIAHDRLVDYYRRQSLRRTEALPEGLFDSGAGPEAAAFEQLEQQRLNRLLRMLTEEQQQVIQLRFIEGFDLAETAAMLGKTVGAIKAMQHRALSTLASQWEKAA